MLFRSNKQTRLRQVPKENASQTTLKRHRFVLFFAIFFTLDEQSNQETCFEFQCQRIQTELNRLQLRSRF